MNKQVPIIFISLGIVALFVGLFFGLLGSVQYIIPEFFETIIPFQRTRPLHVSSVVAWIFFVATGGIYYYLKEKLLEDTRAPFLHLSINLLAIILIPLSLLFGVFGGREYMEWYPGLSLIIIISWLIFGFHFFRRLISSINSWPVYIWMWSTGILFYLFTFTEAQLWLFEYIRVDHIKDMTIQWKSYGSLVGSWNMLVYGTAIYIGSKISKHDASFSRAGFLLYFLGLTNLILGWAHHVYVLPNEYWIRVLAYGTSMTEWLILFRMIWQWSSEEALIDPKYKLVAKILRGTDLWILLNLFLALLISIPAINYYTHGTHITVAHSMGTTIGINTSILLASVFLIYSKIGGPFHQYKKRRRFLYLFHISLIVFWVALILSGLEKSYWVHHKETISHSVITMAQRPYMMVLSIGGIGLITALYKLLSPVLKHFTKQIRNG